MMMNRNKLLTEDILIIMEVVRSVGAVHGHGDALLLHLPLQRVDAGLVILPGYMYHVIVELSRRYTSEYEGLRNSAGLYHIIVELLEGLLVSTKGFVILPGYRYHVIVEHSRRVLASMKGFVILPGYITL